MNKKIFFTLIGIFLLGLILRLMYFNDATFGWDQARDAFESINILNGDFIKIIGPATAELPGLHHGSFYWYLISPFYFFSNGNPLVVRLFLVLLNLASVFILYHLVTLLFKNKSIALLSCLLFALSFEAIQYGRWLSNPSPALLTILLTFTGIWHVINDKKWGVSIALISWSLSVHFQFFLLYQFVFIAPILFWGYKTKKIKLDKESFFAFLASFLIFLTFVIAEFKFNFQGIKSFTHLSAGESLTSNLSGILSDFANRLANTFYFNITGHNLIFAGVVTIAIIVLSITYIIRKKDKKKEFVFLILWLLSPLVPLAFGRATAYFLTIGNLFPAIILTSFFLVKLGENVKYQRIYYIFLILVLFLGQFNLINENNQNGETLFSVQKKMILSDEQKVIDYIYLQSNKKPFVVNSVTNPLFINTTWSYLLNWYGKPKYGYMPIWGGYPQTGQFGSDIKFSPAEDQIKKDLYVIIEPQPGIPDHIISGVSKYEDTRSTFIEERKFGNFTVQKRRLFNSNGFDSDTMYMLIEKYKL